MFEILMHLENSWFSTYQFPIGYLRLYIHVTVQLYIHCTYDMSSLASQTRLRIFGWTAKGLVHRLGLSCSCVQNHTQPIRFTFTVT